MFKVCDLEEERNIFSKYEMVTFFTCYRNVRKNKDCEKPLKNNHGSIEYQLCALACDRCFIYFLNPYDNLIRLILLSWFLRWDFKKCFLKVTELVSKWWNQNLNPSLLISKLILLTTLLFHLHFTIKLTIKKLCPFRM